MKKLTLLFTIILAASLFISCGNKALKDDYGCFVNYEDALDNSEKKKQPLLMFFTSEGDDEESTQLAADIFKHPDFSSEILKKYTVFHADFSENAWKKLTEEEQNNFNIVLQNNYQLAMLLGVDVMPQIFLCTKEGYLVTQIESDDGFMSMTEFQMLLEESGEKLEKFNNMVAATNKGSATTRIEAVDTLYNATDENFRIFLLPMVKLVLELDKNNESGLLGKYIMVNAETEALTAYSQGDTEAAIKKYLEVADNKFVKNEDKQECFYTAAYLAAYSGSEDYQGIITYLQTAYELSPDSAKAPAIKDAITYFQTVIEKKDEFNLENEVDAK